MELIDYMRFRWALLAGGALLGLLVILVVGLGLGGSTYHAKAQLLVRPPINQLNNYGSNLDRYINTEMALLYTSDSLDRNVKGTGVTSTQLARSLSYAHNPESDIVNLEVTSSDPDKAVLVVNQVAKNYVETARKRSTEPAAAEAAKLEADIASTRARLARTNAEIERAVSEFALSNPDRGVPPASSVSPGASSRQSLLTAELQRLGQEQADLGPTSDSRPLTRVLHQATGAISHGAWGPINFLTALLGLLLTLLALSGLGLVLSKRVLGEGRWADVTSGSSLARAVRLRRHTESQRRETVRLVIAVLRRIGTPDANVLVAYLPEETPAISEKSAFLLDGLRDAGLHVEETTSLSRPGGHNKVDAPVLLLVDLQKCHLDEAALLGDYPESVQRRLVPVLV